MLQSSPVVSIVMNCFNSAEHLREALDSVMSQTFKDYEIIFWDNCSEDDSPIIAQSYGKSVKYFRGDHTVPLGAARNLAIAKTNGAYIAFLDCDDLWSPLKLETQVALLTKNPAVGLVTTDTVVFDSRGELRRIFATSRPARGRVFSELVKRQWISMSSAVIRREALASLVNTQGNEGGGWFDETLNVCEEADVFYRIAHDWELDYVDAPYTKWRIHGANTTLRKFAQFAVETRKILDKQRILYPGYDIEHADLVNILNKRSAFEEAVALWQHGNGVEARRVLFPYRNENRKNKIFWFLTYFPSITFDIAARLYFYLPRFFHS